MKQAFLLVLVAAMLLTTACKGNGTNSKVTPNDPTSTGTAEPETKTYHVSDVGTETPINRKEELPAPTLPPIPAPENTVVPQEPQEEPTETANVLPKDPVEQTIEGVWITFYCCDVEGYCQGTSSGVNLQEGGTNKYAACDTNYWPFGTRMTIDSDPNDQKFVWECVDRGSAVKGPSHWDLWFNNCADGQKYLGKIGGDTVTVKILP